MRKLNSIYFCNKVKRRLRTRDRRVSPINGDLEGIHHVTVLAGTNELIVSEDMMHVYRDKVRTAACRMFKSLKLTEKGKT